MVFKKKRTEPELIEELKKIDDQLIKINIENQDTENVWELQSLLEEELYLKAYENSYGFLMGSWSSFERCEFVQSKHLHAMAEHLDACFRGEIKQLIINIPPRNSKTSLVTRSFPAYCWMKRPTMSIANISYSDILAVDDAVASKNIINSYWYRKGLNTLWKDLNLEYDPEYDVWELTKDRKNLQNDYYNTAHGRRFATSIGGTFTGKGGDMLIIDDPLNAKDAYSKVEKANCISWATGVMPSRLDDPKTGVKILVMQRLDVDDLSGYFREQGGWELLKLPMEWDESQRYFTSIGWTDWRRKKNELLNPLRFPEEVVEQFKKNEYAYAAQYQQEPVIIGGGLIKESWWKKWYFLPNEFDGACIAIDLNTKKGEDNDNTAIIVVGKKDSSFYIIDLVYGNMDIVEQLEAIKTICDKYPYINARLIEDKSNGSAVWTMLNRTVTGLIPVDPKGLAKETRIMSIVPLINAGNVNIPDKEILSWIKPLIIEAEQFPKGKHDDALDVLTYTLDYLQNNNCYIKMPVSTLQINKQAEVRNNIKTELLGEIYGVPIRANNKYIKGLFNF